LLRWEEAVHEIKFRFRVYATEQGRRLHGGLDVYLGVMLISVVPFSTRVGLHVPTQLSRKHSVIP